MKIPGAWLAATIFALHPVQVESVAWVSELKNISLAGVFYIAVLALAHLEFGSQPRVGVIMSWPFGIVSRWRLMSKTASPLPCQHCCSSSSGGNGESCPCGGDVLPLILFFVTGITAGLFTAWRGVEIRQSRGSEYDFSLCPERFLIAGRGIWFYLGKFFWPANLIFSIPAGRSANAVWGQYLFPAWRRCCWAVWVWLPAMVGRGPLPRAFFVITLFPALGFFNVYTVPLFVRGDHFQYLAGIGPIVLVHRALASVQTDLKSKDVLGPGTGRNPAGSTRGFDLAASRDVCRSRNALADDHCPEPELLDGVQ